VVKKSHCFRPDPEVTALGIGAYAEDVVLVIVRLHFPAADILSTILLHF
jgi:hypothetical protein